MTEEERLAHVKEVSTYKYLPSKYVTNCFYHLSKYIALCFNLTNINGVEALFLYSKYSDIYATKFPVVIFLASISL